MRRPPLQSLLLGTTLLAGGAAFAQDVTLTIESWRNDDLTIWQEKIIPAFEAAHPGIKLNFNPTAPRRIQRRAELQARRRLGRRPHHLPAVRRLARALREGPARRPDRPRGDGELRRRGEVRLVDRRRRRRPSACRWPRCSTASSTTRPPSRSSGSRCRRPRPSSSPLLDKIKADGTYIPMAMGTNDQWEAATMGYQNIGPNYWKGEEGRLALIEGEQKLTDPQWVAPFTDDRQVEGLPRRRLRGADLPRQPEPLHPRPRRHLPGRLLGDRAVPRPDRRRLRDGRLPAAGRRTRATPATSPTTSTSPSG